MAKQAAQSMESIITSTAKNLYKNSEEFKSEGTPWNHLSVKKRESYRTQAKVIVENKTPVAA